MVDRVYWRLTDMRNAILEIRKLLDGRQIATLASNPPTRAAFERFLEIMSEASRHVPDEWKAEFDTIPWRQVADLGNFLRHAYHKTDLEILWSIYENDLQPLEFAIDQMIARSGPPDSDIKT
jgi:uncharacterized protein with HEPN domain